MALPLSRDEARARRRGRLTLVFLAALFLGPVAFSYVYHQLGFRWHPAPSTAGVLFDPPQPVGLAPPAKGAPGWRLVALGNGACDSACTARLDQLRRVHTALGRHAEKFALLYVPDGAGVLPAGVSGFAILPDPEGHLRAQLFGLSHEIPADLYVIDPMGYALLYYPRGVAGKAILADLGKIARRFGGD